MRYWEAEARFDRVRSRIGFTLAPLLFVGLLLFPFPGLTPEAHRRHSMTVVPVPR